MLKSQKIIDQLNSLGKKKEPFVFLIDFEGFGTKANGAANGY